MKKWLVCLLVGVFSLSAGMMVSSLFDRSDESTSYDRTLNERLENRTGDVLLKLTKNIELTTSGTRTCLGPYGVSTVTVDGSGMTITATGAAKSIVKRSGSGLLVFKDLTLVDRTDDVYSAWENYLWFGGKLRFEDCTIVNSIYLTDNVDAEFVNCRFISPATKQYSVWVADGSARFENCTFTGYRGMKINEFEGGDDVESVTVENCTFNRLFEKPGLAIGSMINNPQETTITVTNSRFEYCAAWDSEGSLVGIDGFYEADTFLEEFVFQESDNTVLF